MNEAILANSFFDLPEAVKAGPDDLTLDVLGAPYGMDKQGQEFHAGTDFGPSPVVPVLYWHGFGQNDFEWLGWAYKAQRDERGQWFRVVLDATKDLARRIFNAAKAGKARASSDAMSHLVRPAGILGRPGKVDKWPIGALSLMDDRNFETAVNPRAVAIPAVRAIYQSALAALEDPTGEADATKAGAKFSRDTRSRLREIREAITAAFARLDEMFGEFPADEVSPDTPATNAVKTGKVGTFAVKGTIPMNEKENISPEAGQPAPEQTPDIVTEAVKAAQAEAGVSVEPKDVAPTYTEAQVREMVNKAAREAVKAVQRPNLSNLGSQGAPVTRKSATPKPFFWAVAAAKATGGNIRFNLENADAELEFDGSAEAVKAFKAMATTAGSTIGEHFVPNVQTSVVIEQLYADVVIDKLPGVVDYPMPSKVCDMPTIGAFSAGWTAENATAANAGDAATNKKQLVAKKLTALGKLSNELLSWSNPSVEPYVMRGIRNAIGEEFDKGGFIYDGTSNRPTGLLNQAGVTSTAVGADDIYTAIIKATGRMAVNKLPYRNISVIMRPEVAVKWLTTRTGTNGDFLGASGGMTNTALLGPSIQSLISARLGLPVFLTPHLPVSTDAKSSVLVLFGENFVIGRMKSLDIQSSNVAGTSFENDQTWIRAIMFADFALQRPAALEIITGVAH